MTWTVSVIANLVRVNRPDVVYAVEGETGPEDAA